MDSTDRIEFLGRVKRAWLEEAANLKLAHADRDAGLKLFLNGVLVGVAHALWERQDSISAHEDDILFEAGQECGRQGGDLSDLDAVMLLADLAGVSAVEALDV